MRLFLCGLLTVLTLLVLGCSSSDTTSKEAAVLDQQQSTTMGQSDTQSVIDSSVEEDLFVSDSLVSAMLELARQHYLSATNAQLNGDRERTVTQFEESISILNDLSYYPDIESNRDFSDLSKTVIDDYETHIAKIDTLDTESSIFALREKLNQFTESQDSVDAGPPTEVIGGTTIPLVTNKIVDQHIAFFQGKGRVHMERWIYQSGKYFPILRRILREEGVPEELTYLAMVESGLNPVARSWARAVGMWQFMKGTGRMYGLRTTSWYDERRDFEKATRAAARHLNDLHAEFGDWYLAMAAYNSGAGRVYRGIRRSGSTDFWTMRRYLPRETRNYVPSFIATAIIFMNPKEYGFHGIDLADELEFETVSVDDCVDLETLASCANTEASVLRELNPELVHWCTPPATRAYELRVPPGGSKDFVKRYAAIPDDQKRNWIMHMVRRGETLGGIARKYGIGTDIVMEVNKIKSARRLSIGKSLMIPIPRGSTQYASVMERRDNVSERTATRKKVNTGRVEKALAASKRYAPANRDNSEELTYIVKKGDTIGHIAEWYSCRAADIRNWNDLPYGRTIHPGQRLTVWVKKSDLAKYEKINSMSFAKKEGTTATTVPAPSDDANGGGTRYTVRPGDTLEKIAQEHNVSIKQIKGWNNLRSSRINAGQELIIYIEAANVNTSSSNKNVDVKNLPSDVRAISYRVKSGDTLWDIARAHSVEEIDIKKWNDLRRNTIYAGQELLIYKDKVAAK